MQQLFPALKWNHSGPRTCISKSESSSHVNLDCILPRGVHYSRGARQYNSLRSAPIKSCTITPGGRTIWDVDDDCNWPWMRRGVCACVCVWRQTLCGNYSIYFSRRIIINAYILLILLRPLYRDIPRVTQWTL